MAGIPSIYKVLWALSTPDLWNKVKNHRHKIKYTTHQNAQLSLLECNIYFFHFLLDKPSKMCGHSPAFLKTGSFQKKTSRDYCRYPCKNPFCLKPKHPKNSAEPLRSVPKAPMGVPSIYRTPPTCGSISESYINFLV